MYGVWDIISDFSLFSHTRGYSTLVTVLPVMSMDTSGSRVALTVSFPNGSHFTERGLNQTKMSSTSRGTVSPLLRSSLP